jgi:hypothetical protein
VERFKKGVYDFMICISLGHGGIKWYEEGGMHGTHDVYLGKSMIWYM